MILWIDWLIRVAFIPCHRLLNHGTDRSTIYNSPLRWQQKTYQYQGRLLQKELPRLYAILFNISFSLLSSLYIRQLLFKVSCYILGNSLHIVIIQNALVCRHPFHRD